MPNGSGSICRLGHDNVRTKGVPFHASPASKERPFLLHSCPSHLSHRLHSCNSGTHFASAGTLWRQFPDQARDFPQLVGAAANTTATGRTPRRTAAGIQLGLLVPGTVATIPCCSLSRSEIVLSLSRGNRDRGSIGITKFGLHRRCHEVSSGTPTSAATTAESATARDGHRSRPGRHAIR